MIAVDTSPLVTIMLDKPAFVLPRGLISNPWFERTAAGGPARS